MMIVQTIVYLASTATDNVTRSTNTTSDGLLASAGDYDNGNIRIWDPKTSHGLYDLEGHTKSGI
jgi:hypothetical protein